MLYSYYTLRLLAAGLKEALSGLAIAEAYSQERQHLTIGFGEEHPALIIACLPHAATLFLHPRHSRARRNAASVLPRLAGLTVRDVAVHPSDRIVVTELNEDLRLAALCYGPSPNVLLLDRGDTVVDAFLNARNLIGTVHPLPPAAEQEIPDLGAIDRALDGTAPIAERLGRSLPRFGRTLVRELMHRADIAPGSVAASASERERLRTELFALHRELAGPGPAIYMDGQTPAAFSLVPLRHLTGAVPRPFTDIHEAVRTFLGRRRSAFRRDEERSAVTAQLTRALEKIRRTIAAVRDDLARADRAGDYERRGHLLIMHQHAVQRGAPSAVLDDGSGALEITLDPRRSAVENAQRFFDKARAARTARQEAGSRLAELEERARRAAALLAAVGEAATPDDLQHLRQERADDLADFGIRPAGSPSPPPLPFRVFTVEGGFQVWAGKSSANNDLLTGRHARPNDLWFHARGGSGAHVVLKTGSAAGEPGKRAREQAAAIAAWYSKLKKAGLVPVAMTERKYVRKPKGAPPGTVTIDRETVLLVRPGLPDSEKSG